MDKQHSHGGHRQRLKKRFVQTGLESFEKHNILELLLFYGVPQKDTNELAHHLIDSFGSISAVFEASYDDLIQVNGVGENVAVLLKLIPELARVYAEERAETYEKYDTSDKLCAFFAAKFIGLKQEAVYVAALDNTGKMIGCVQLTKGTAESVPLVIEDVVKFAFKHNAKNIVMAHNHPIGLANPSATDHINTIELKKVLAPLNITLMDHIIVGKNGDSLSMVKYGLMD